MQSFLTRAASTAYRWYYWYKKSDDWAVQAMTDILAWGLERGTPASYRAFVKDAWSLFLMYTWGGYVLDAGWGRSTRAACPSPSRRPLSTSNAIEKWGFRSTLLIS
jgi:hypothetical protein